MIKDKRDKVSNKLYRGNEKRECLKFLLAICNNSVKHIKCIMYLRNPFL